MWKNGGNKVRCAYYEVCLGALPLPTGEGGRRPGEGSSNCKYCAPHPALWATLSRWEKDRPSNFCQLELVRARQNSVGITRSCTATFSPGATRNGVPRSSYCLMKSALRYAFGSTLLNAKAL